MRILPITMKGLGLASKLLALSAMLLFSSFQASAAIKFLPNKGQWSSNVLYKADIPGGAFFLEKTGLTYFFYDEKALHDAAHNNTPGTSIKCHVVRVDFLNSTGPQSIEGSLPGMERYNFFIGKDPSKWASGLSSFEKLTLSNLWPGIDMQIFSHDESIKYTFIVHPRADPSMIRLQYRGASSLALSKEGFHINSTLTDMEEENPVAYFEFRKGRGDVDVAYQLQDSIIGFKVGHYNKRGMLYIDPTLVFSTFSGSVADNWGFTATYNHDGNGFSGGTVYSAGYPVTTGAYQQKFMGGWDNDAMHEWARDDGILKYSADGKQLIWATYLGGSNNEQPHSMVVDSKGNLIIFGNTLSTDFPTTSGCYNSNNNGNGDIYISKLSADGSKLLASTLIGGSGRDGFNGDRPDRYPSGPLAYNYGDQYRGEVIVDSFNNIYVATCTQSKDFPISGGFQQSFGGGTQDGVVMKFGPALDKLLWSSYLGGNNADAAYGINLDYNDNVYVCGGTMSSNFPTSGNAKWKGFLGDRDGFLTKISTDGSSILASTFVGTSQYDQCYFVQLDNRQRVYVTGQTTGPFPVVGNVYRNTAGTQFIAAFVNDLSDLSLSTTFGSGRKSVDLSPSAFLVDLCGRVYVSGWGGSVNSFYNSSAGSTYNLPLSADAFQRKTDGSDFYLIILSKEMKSLVYATYFGGSISEEHVDGGTSRFDRDGKVYQSVCGGCGGYSDFPTTKGAWSQINKGRRPNDPLEGGCNNALFKIDLNSSNFAPKFQDTTLVVTATTELNYDFDVTDADLTDSIYLTYSGDVFDPKKVTPPVASLKADNGVGIIHGHFKWQTTCGHRSNDTFVVNIVVRDNGCPTPRVTYGKIKIVILPPPVPDPPAIFCINRVNSNTLQINWDEFKVDKYLAGYKLVKKFPDGNETVLKTITSRSDKSYTDYNAPSHLTTDYCYYMYGVNICGDTGTHTRTICSIPDKDSIPKVVNIYTVSVENDRQVRVSWKMYQKNDFYYYLVYKRENKDGETFKLYRTIKTQTDTTFLDSNVDVHAKSYCYKVIARNQCGLQSPEGDYGCSILLTGESIPFEHHLSWNTYKQWSDGVRKYQVIRWDPSKPDSVIGTKKNLVQTARSENFTDDSLNYDMGLYYYRIIAFEEGSSGDSAVSISNTITLIQKPIVHIPNAFTPNKDSTNDRWALVPVFVKDYHLRVYNRWGERVWETSDKHASWDGMFKNYLSQDDVLIYLLQFTGWDGSNNYRQGNLTILK